MQEGERRVAITPEGAKALKGKGFDVAVQSNAGLKAGFLDDQYRDAGAEIISSAEETYQQADLIAKVNGPSDADDEALHLRTGCSLISFLNPASNPKTVGTLSKRNVTAFAMELIPRITRAQSMDALSAMSTVAGYK